VADEAIYEQSNSKYSQGHLTLRISSFLLILGDEPIKFYDLQGTCKFSERLLNVRQRVIKSTAKVNICKLVLSTHNVYCIQQMLSSHWYTTRTQKLDLLGYMQIFYNSGLLHTKLWHFAF
jgi:hypothetical protein